MRILVVSDLHGSGRAAVMIRENLARHQPDALVAAGDLTNFGPATYARELLAGLPVPVPALPGNCDRRDLLPVVDGMGMIRRGRRATVGGRTFVGVGGSTPTPFG